MVKSAPMRDQTVTSKPRRRSGAGLVTLLVVLFITAMLALGFGLFFPARYALVQERALALLHGGIVQSEEHSYVDACVLIAGAEEPHAVKRTVRTTIFQDGTTLSVVFSERPTPTNGQCGG